MAKTCNMSLEPEDVTVGLTVGEAMLYCYNYMNP